MPKAPRVVLCIVGEQGFEVREILEVDGPRVPDEQIVDLHPVGDGLEVERHAGSFGSGDERCEVSAG